MAKPKTTKAKTAKPKAPRVRPRAVDEHAEDWYSERPESPEAEAMRRRREVAKAVRTSRVRQAREDPNAFAEYAFEDSVTGNKLRQAKVHRDLQEAIRDRDVDHLMVEFPRNHGKCCAAGTLIHLEDGSLVPVEVFDSGRVLTMDDTFRIVSGDATCQSNGIKDCITVLTKTGRELVVSHDHPFRTGNGWTAAEDLDAGVRVAVMNGCSVPVQGDMDELDAYVIGVMVGDGGTTDRARVTCSDQAVLNQVRQWSDRHGWTVSHVDGYDYSITGHKGAKSGGPTHYLRDMGLMGCRSHNKTIPHQVLVGGDQARAAFLAGYFDADGTVNNKDGGSAEFYSVNKPLLVTVQDVLARFGIVSTISRKRGMYRKKHHLSWRLTIRGDGLDRFRNIVRPRGDKADRIDSLDCGGGDGNGAKLDLFPDELWRPHVKATGLSLRQQGLRIDTKNRISRPKLRRLAELDDNDKLRQVANGQVFWDEVTSVEPVGPRETYDLTVSGTHNFVSHGFVTHNTTQVEISILWLLGQDPNLRFKIVCESDNKAQERVQHLAQHIMGNSRIRDVFPHLRPARRGDWTKKKIVVDRPRLMRDVSIEACGIQTAATGGRADYLVADDPVGRRNALEIPKLRETVKRAWHSDWLNLLEPTGRTIYVYTPWHTADLSHKLKRNPVYRVFSRPIGPKMEPVWEAKWPVEKLEAKLAEVGQREFDRGYRLIALSGEYATVQDSWVQYWTEEPNLADLIVFTAYDLSTGEGEDFFSSVTVGLDGRDLGQAQPRIYVLDAWHGHLTFMAQVGAVLQEAKLWLPQAVALEAVQYQAVLPQVLQAARDDKRTELTADIVPVRPRLSKALRLSAITPLLELGRVSFNPALDPGRGLKGDLVEELTMFPLAAHDDLVDAFVYATALAVDYSIRAGGRGVSVSSYGADRSRGQAPEAPVQAPDGAILTSTGQANDVPDEAVREAVEGGSVPPIYSWANLGD